MDKIEFSRGFDVSKWQTKLDWLKLKTWANFCFVKLSQYNYADPKYKEHAKNALENIMYVGGYCYLDKNHITLPQIKLFSYLYKQYDFTLPPVIDVEGISATPIWWREQVRIAILETQNLTGKKPIIYTSDYYWSILFPKKPNWLDHHLWVSDYGKGEEEMTFEKANDTMFKNPKYPRLPNGFSNWMIWQFSEYGKVSGNDGNLDLNVSNGPIDHILRLIE